MSYCLLTFLAGALWSSVNALRRSARAVLAQLGVGRPVRLPARVVSVGNLEAGGTGKTPIVAWIAQEAARRGQKVWILTRGYGGEGSQAGRMIRPGESADPLECGDEAVLLAHLAPQAAIGVGADRLGSFKRMCETLGDLPDLIVLDDGFAQLGIEQDAKILAVTSRGRSEQIYREWTGTAQLADLLIWTKGEREPAAWRAAPEVARAHPGWKLAPPANAEARHWLVCGIGHPRAAAVAARAAGYRIEREIAFPDHARYSAEIVQEIVDQATHAGATVLTTGKDAVKWRALGVMRASIAVIEPGLDWSGDPQGRARCENLIWPA